MYNRDMRTTIELKPEHRSRILELAAKRGEKGFSNVVSEALDLYLEAQRTKKVAIQKALTVKGCLKEAEGDELRARTHQIREHWR